MDLIGTIAAALFVFLGVIFLAPVFFTRAIRETYKEVGFWGLMTDLPNWISYLILLCVSIGFWWGMGYLFFVVL